MKLNPDFNGNQGASKRALVLTERTGHFGWLCSWGTIYAGFTVFKNMVLEHCVCCGITWIVQLLAGYIVWGRLRNHSVKFIWISRERIMGFLFGASKHQKELTIVEAGGVFSAMFLHSMESHNSESPFLSWYMPNIGCYMMLHCYPRISRG